MEEPKRTLNDLDVCPHVRSTGLTTHQWHGVPHKYLHCAGSHLTKPWPTADATVVTVSKPKTQNSFPGGFVRDMIKAIYWIWGKIR